MISAYPDSRGTCVRVDLHAIAHNVRAIRRELGENVQLMAVVKANAYGHGLIPVAQTALQNGASCLAVAMPEEGRRLREAGVQAPILVLGNATAAGAEISVREGLIQTVFDPAGVRCLQNACARQNQPVQVHLKLDTGMGRIGARDENEVRAALAALRAVCALYALDRNAACGADPARCGQRCVAALSLGAAEHGARGHRHLRLPGCRLRAASAPGHAV